MQPINQLHVALVFVIICSVHQCTQGLRCFSCSGENYCKPNIKDHPERVGRCRVNDGKCFVRRDPNGEIYHGCIYDGFWPGVPWRSYKGCAEDWKHGWIYGGKKRPIVWCVCNRNDCNVRMGTVTPKSTTTQSTVTATDDLTTGDTQEPMTSTSPSRLTTTDTSSNITCPVDFQRVAGETSCYKVVSPTLADVNESRDYQQACNTCQSYGAHLVSIESIQEQRNLASVLRTQPEILQGWQGWWTSGQLMPGTNLFVWRSSNSLVFVDRRLWGFVQSPVRDTCIWIMSISYFNYTLGNYDCSTRAGYICEIDMPDHG